MTPYLLQPGEWAGLTEFPVRPDWPASSPVLVTAVQPLKTGAGRLLIDLIQPLAPIAARRLTVVVTVVQQGEGHCTGLWVDGNGPGTVVLAEPTFAWLRSCCATLLHRRRPAGPLFRIDRGGRTEAIGAPDYREYLRASLGRNADAVLHGAGADSFGAERPPMPAGHAGLMIDRTLAPFDSCLAQRGVIPQQMEDRWFIHAEDGRLLFRRSWTGHLIYDLEIAWRGERLYLGAASVNRAPSQYRETDVLADTRNLNALIDGLLCGRRGDEPSIWI
jgi:hypothetical protein